MHLKISSGKLQPFCLGLTMLIRYCLYNQRSGSSCYVYLELIEINQGEAKKSRLDTTRFLKRLRSPTLIYPWDRTKPSVTCFKAGLNVPYAAYFYQLEKITQQNKQVQ